MWQYQQQKIWISVALKRRKECAALHNAIPYLSAYNVRRRITRTPILKGNFLEKLIFLVQIVNAVTIKDKIRSNVQQATPVA